MKPEPKAAGFLPGPGDAAIDLLARGEPALVGRLLLAANPQANLAWIKDPEAQPGELRVKYSTPPRWADAPPAPREPVRAVGPALGDAQAKAWIALFKSGTITATRP